MHGELPIQTCAKTLRAAATRYDLCLIAPGVETYVEELIIKVRSPVTFKHVVDLPDNELWDEFVVGKLYPFLSETHLVLQATTFAERYSIIFSNHFHLACTERAWGQLYSRWANSNRWLGKNDWSYVDLFTGTPSVISDDYSEWSDNAFAVIESMTDNLPS